MKDSIIVKFLYKTTLGRTILKLLVNPKLSKLAAHLFSSPFSRFFIPAFANKNNIDMSLYEIPEGGYKSFNDFFTRKIKKGIAICGNGLLISPCDANLTVADIDENYIFRIKHTEYSIKELIDNEKMAYEYINGMALIFRLTPAHYHRYCFCTDAIVAKRRKIKGILHSVQPVCHEMTKVFVQNSREYAVLRSEALGNVIQMEVGALLVGKISNYQYKENDIVKHGDEKGYFEYGGSSIVVLLPGRYNISENVLKREKSGDEIAVKYGESLIEKYLK